jgi:hypothetical protein
VLLERRATSCSATAPGDAVFRTARGAPLSPRRYSTIFGRARPCLDWADRTRSRTLIARTMCIRPRSPCWRRASVIAGARTLRGAAVR